jgi:hypothetical protein
MQRPWFRRQTWSWYVEVDGKQNNLGKHPTDEAPIKLPWIASRTSGTSLEV